MLLFFIYCVLFLSSALSRHVPRYMDLEEEDQELFRAAYDTPSYNQDEYEEDDLPLGKLDLGKDGLWALKAKLKELKTFDKALAANLLSTKLKVKELLKNHLGPLKKHHHVKIYDEKPNYGYQAPNYGYQAPSYQAPQYEAPHYNAPPQYAAPAAYQYAAPPAPQYAPPAGHDPYYGN